MDLKSSLIRVSKKDKKLLGGISLDGSKSISNRALIIQALSPNSVQLSHLSTSDDTTYLINALRSNSTEINVGHAGTCMRFLTALFAIGSDDKILTGSQRLQERPIGPLVDALRSIGADIEYLKNESFPPLKIHPFKAQKADSIKINAGVSSQFITALLLIAPSLPQGLTIELEGEIVSRSYLEMSINLLKHFGAHIAMEGNFIQIAPGAYKENELQVEGDWSAASYYFILAAFANEVELQLNGVYEESLQGDSAIREIARAFGVQHEFNENGIMLSKSPKKKELLEYDFLLCPDIAQSVFTMCAGLGTQGLFSGLQTLSIKETDRISAMNTELNRLGASLSKLPPRFSKSNKDFYLQQGTAEPNGIPRFQTYKDHRMAMSLACLSILFPIEIEDSAVVSKSYPNFWKDLESLGFEIAPVSEQTYS